MKNKELCKMCKYAGTVGSRCGDSLSITCDYGLITKQAAIGRRGNDPDKCLLFEKGERIERRQPEKIYKTIKTTARRIDKSQS
jgi:hypothetical protein